MNQNIGQFSGKIAEGKPPTFQAQFPYFDTPEMIPSFKEMNGQIPEFSAPVKVPGNPEKEDELLAVIIRKNKENINNDVINLFAKYQERINIKKQELKDQDS